jgi:hypothetical protein
MEAGSRVYPSLRCREQSHPSSRYVSLTLERAYANVGTTELPEQLLEPSIADASAYHSSVLQRSKALNDAPMLTSKHRDEAKAKAEAKRSEKWPTVRLLIWHELTRRQLFGSNSLIARRFKVPFLPPVGKSK